MFAIAFDMVVDDLKNHYSQTNPNNAYYAIRNVMAQYGFFNTQGSLYLTKSDDFSCLLLVMNALKALPWFTASVRDIRAFRVENWSDFTAFMKGTATGSSISGIKPNSPRPKKKTI